jgi:23S rRNA (pseudouridine1915-N3)-methyltransferase
MLLSIHAIAPRAKSAHAAALRAEYEQRLSQYVGGLLAERLPSEAALFKKLRTEGRTAPRLVLLDSRGRLLSSEELAGWMGRERDAGTQQLVFAIGPADGWSAEARSRADLLLSFGPMTFPHELARVMLTEQLYRAFTILAGHPYHTGHASAL